MSQPNSETNLRSLHFDRLEEAVAEVDRLAGSQVETTGNYTFGQILEHLARTFDIVSGHKELSFKPNLVMRTFARSMLSKILNGPPQPGFELPAAAQGEFWPESDVPIEEALKHFHEAFARYQATQPLPKHLFFGKMSQEQHDQLQCRHCELHLGFVKPVV